MTAAALAATAGVAAFMVWNVFSFCKMRREQTRCWQQHHPFCSIEMPLLDYCHDEDVLEKAHMSPEQWINACRQCYKMKCRIALLDQDIKELWRQNQSDRLYRRCRNLARQQLDEMTGELTKFVPDSKT